MGVLLSRDGTVKRVTVGDADHLEIPEIGRLRGRLGRLRGLRLVHTHLRGEGLTDDDLNDLALLRLDLVAMIGVGESGRPGPIELAHVLPLPDEVSSEDLAPFHFVSAPDPGRLDFDLAETVRALEEEFSKVVGSARMTRRERALVVGIHLESDHFQETVELAESADVDVAGCLRQRRRMPHPKTVVGSGKIREIVLEGMRRQADVAIFDVDLKPAQSRAFEDATGFKAVDRTQLIMDIFAQRARSRDGKLQVELAQLKYALPRLSERESGLSRLTGGIGGRGPGETTLEIGRRRIRDRIRRLEKEVAALARQRDVRRARRERSDTPVVSIVGYTNAGKTTLLNALTESSVEARDQLFVTLDPTTRRMRFPREGDVILSDTVGFLRDLPADLVAAFRATLEELSRSDLLLHVCDASEEHLEEKMQAVLKLLKELDLLDIPRLTVLNKADRIPPEEWAHLERRYGAVAVSARHREGLGRLMERAERILTGEGVLP